MEMIWKTKRYLPYAAMAFAVASLVATTLCCDAVAGIYLASLALLSYETAR